MKYIILSVLLMSLGWYLIKFIDISLKEFK